MGVSGGGGEPRCARVVEVDAVELSLLIEVGLGEAKLLDGAAPLEDELPGGGQYC